MRKSYTADFTHRSSWNGHVCSRCGARYYGYHECSAADILRKVADLLDGLQEQLTAGSEDPTRSCPCRPENGGSGICGCVLGGPKITC